MKFLRESSNETILIIFKHCDKKSHISHFPALLKNVIWQHFLQRNSNFEYLLKNRDFPGNYNNNHRK